MVQVVRSQLILDFLLLRLLHTLQPLLNLHVQAPLVATLLAHLGRQRVIRVHHVDWSVEDITKGGGESIAFEVAGEHGIDSRHVLVIAR